MNPYFPLEVLSYLYGKSFQFSPQNLAIPFNVKSTLTIIEDVSTNRYIIKKLPPLYVKFYGMEIYKKGLQFITNYAKELSLPLLGYIPNRYGEVISFINDSAYVLADFYEAVAYDGSDRQITTIAQKHAAINKALHNIPESTQQFMKEHFSTGPYLRNGDIYHLLEEIKKKFSIEIKNGQNKFTKTFKKLLGIVEKELQLLPPHLFEGLPYQIVHKDIFPGNVLFLRDDSAIVIDPDEVMYLPHVRDFVYGMWCFATRKSDGSLTAPDPQLLRLYFECYNRENPLSKFEILQIPSVAKYIWIEDFLNFAMNVNFTDESLPDLERKIVHLKHSIDAELALSLLQYDLIIFDFDGTIGKLSVDWPSFKKALHLHFKDKFDKDISFEEYSKGCNKAFRETGEEGFQDINRIALSFEEKNISEFKKNSYIFPYIYNFSGTKVIWSSNTCSVIKKLIDYMNLGDSFDYIISREQTRMLKPNLNGFKVIKKNLGRTIDAAKILFIGDSNSDMMAAEKIGCSYLDITSVGKNK